MHKHGYHHAYRNIDMLLFCFVRCQFLANVYDFKTHILLKGSEVILNDMGKIDWKQAAMNPQNVNHGIIQWV